MGMVKDSTVSDFVYNIFRLDAAKNCFGPSRTTLYTLCKHDQLFVFNCAADSILHQPITNFKMLKVMDRKPLLLKLLWNFKWVNLLACWILIQWKMVLLKWKNNGTSFLTFFYPRQIEGIGIVVEICGAHTLLGPFSSLYCSRVSVL